MYRRINSAVAFALTLSACSGAPPQADEAEVVFVEGPIHLAFDSFDGRVIVSGDPPGAPEGCALAEVVDRVEALFDEINQGAADVGTRNFVGPDASTPLMWYSLPGHNGVDRIVAENLESIDRVLSLRHEAGERLTLQAIQVNRWDQDVAHMGPILVSREANDLPNGPHLLEGKAAFRCDDGRFVVMGLASRGALTAGR